MAQKNSRLGLRLKNWKDCLDISLLRHPYKHRHSHELVRQYLDFV